MATNAPAAELAAQIERHTSGDGVHATAIPRLSLIRLSHPGEPLVLLHEPAVCIVAQGSKRVHLADEVLVYDASRYLVVSVDLPITGQVLEASPFAPYLCIRLDLDAGELARLLLELGPPAPASQRPTRGLFLSEMTAAMHDAVLRLVRLLDTPEDIAPLAPLAVRELMYRLLKGDEGWRLRQIAAGDGQARRIARAIGWLKQHFAEPLRIDEFARELHMSPSSLHHHFKAVTAMSPLQYQKQLRLQEARRLMFSESLDATTAALRVGYESPTQFSREYSRLFGDPPARDLRRLRDTGGLVRPA
ncbi:AraC family transcriptional regulator [Nannocystis sp. SCPEA4]|uniref:AraC family transcriptional regulator n=1 Tax=Nannocystis sp. SCPEA4 TaxID=2996787 RepID=UPI0022700583|nr:AraC family transcriptional regulator [Nannocystis sp. SCPEA4]MCY1057522.1 AraC family transcriptional regulator [Nannocystis sp. SCPEA4]